MISSTQNPEHRQFDYYTLLVNGSMPDSTIRDTTQHHQVSCKDCPYGGHCVNTITAVANFWGYRVDNDVIFQHCPRGYCCSETVCPSFNACSRNRTGSLCGRCIANHSETLFTHACVPNENCHLGRIVIFGAIIGVFYAVVLFMKSDIQDIIFGRAAVEKNSEKPSKFLPCFNKTKTKTQKHPPEENYQSNLLVVRKFLTTPAEMDKFLVHRSNGSAHPPDGDVDDKHDQNACTWSLNNQPLDSLISDVTAAKNSDGITRQDSPSGDFGSSLMVIMFYYFQDALLLQVDTVFTQQESKRQRWLRLFLSGIFQFRLDLFELWENVCAFPDATPVNNVLLKAAVVPYIIVVYVLVYVLHALCTSSCWKDKTNKSVNATEKFPKSRRKRTMVSRLASGFILSLLFMFQKLGTTTFTLLHCVDVKGEQVLFIDGEIQCYQWWQSIVWVYAALCVIPFFLVLQFGTILLQRGRISLRTYFIGLLFPAPFLVYAFVKWLVSKYGSSTSCADTGGVQGQSDGVRAVLCVLQAPFNESRYGCWSGVLIGRRLFLIVLFTFISDSLIRMLSMLTALFVILVVHVHIKPYKDAKANLAGTLSASALVIFACVNLVRASFEASEHIPSGPNKELMGVLTQVENFLLLYGPLLVLAAVLLVVFLRICDAVKRKIFSTGRF